MDLFKDVFNKFYNKLRLEGFLKSLICALIPSLLISLIISLSLYFLDVNLLWISLIAFLGLSIILTIALYFIVFKVSEEDVARRVDLEGLEERVITMVQSKDSDSLMARLQRDDALKALDEAKNKKLPLKIKRVPLFIMLGLLLISIPSQTLISLSLFGYFPSFNEVIHPELNLVSVRYLDDVGGIVLGEAFQEIKKGESTTEVLALANDGYIFVGWSDGNLYPERKDSNITESMDLRAIFKELDLDMASGSITDDDLPKGDKDNSKPDGNMNGNMPGASGEYIESNQVIDGNTYYRDVYEKYLSDALKLLNEGKEIPEWLRLLVEEYFNVIK